MVDPWRLVPRSIPVLPEIASRFDGVVRCSDEASVDSWRQLISGKSHITIPKNSCQWVELETSSLTTGFLDLSVSVDGADDEPRAAKLTILCSECYEYPMELGKGPPKRVKGDRTDAKGGSLYGTADTYTAHEGSNHYSPFWFRTFRFVRLAIDTTDCSGPVTCTSFTYRATHYPLSIRTTIHTSDALLRPLWDISVRTLRNCMHETYEDCPFYEQNQFAMDTRSMILFTYLLSRDDRLARKAMHEFYASRRADGLVETHFPSPGAATNIPTFSLFWVLMVWDHMVHFGDETLVRRYVGAVDDVLGYFHRRVDARTGLVGQFDADCWAFVDWADGWATMEKGFFGLAVPPAYWKTGSATYHSLVYAYTLAKASELCVFLGRHDTAREYLTRRDDLLASVREHCFDATTGFFLDGPGYQGSRSQHVQVFAVLAGCTSGEDAKTLLRRTVLQREEHGLTKASFALGFYVFRAVGVAGVYEECWETLMRPWEKMIADNLTTWAESESMTRSDCHGWSATPMWEIATEVLGVKTRDERYLDRVVRKQRLEGKTGPEESAFTFSPRLGLVRDSFSADVLVGPGLEDLVHVEVSPTASKASMIGSAELSADTA